VPRTPPVDAATRARALERYAAGQSTHAIAKEIGISHATVNRFVRDAVHDFSAFSRVASETPAASASAPFDGDPKQPPANIPPPNYGGDQPPPSGEYSYTNGYSGHTFKAFGSPLAFEGFTLERVRNAIAMHRQGIFIESSALSIAVLSYGPVLAALGQRVAPILGLPRKIRMGTRGLSRVLGAEVERQLAPRAGLTSSQYFPDTLWGSGAIEDAMMGFHVLQHVDGDPDPVTGVRPRYTRLWPTWAVQYYRYRKTFVAITTEGPVDITNDGKFTLVADSIEPHFTGAIVALGEEAFDGKSTQRARAAYIDRYGNPKWVGTMPQGTAARTPEGQAFFAALATLRGPDGYGVLPNGATYKLEGLSGQTSAVFKDALESNWQYVAAILLGSDGTMTRGTGVYSAPIFAGVRRDLVDRGLKMAVRGANQGHVAPWLALNYAASIASAGGWIDPVLDIPLPDPDSDARIKSYSDRVLSFHKIITAERSAGFEVTEERVAQLSAALDIDPPSLSTQAVSRIGLAPTDMAKVVTVNEARGSAGLPPLPTTDERGEKFISEIAADIGQAVAGAPEPEGELPEGGSEGEPPDGSTAAQQGPAEMASPASKEGGTATGGQNGGALENETAGT
jgi:hypothetical protein